MTQDISWRCAVPGCERTKTRKAGKGMCGHHYEQARQLATPLRECAFAGCEKLIRRRQCSRHPTSRPVAPCLVTDCDLRSSSGGYCTKHHKRIARYGLTPTQLAALIASQGGGCAICGVSQEASPHTLVVDHDHSCCPGRTSCGACVRGVLCRACNVGLGNLRDDPSLLRAALAYLTK